MKEVVNSMVTQHGYQVPAPGKHSWNPAFDMFSKLLHGPLKINISFLSPMADLEEASVKQLILPGNEMYCIPDKQETVRACVFELWHS